MLGDGMNACIWHECINGRSLLTSVFLTRCTLLAVVLRANTATDPSRLQRAFEGVSTKLRLLATDDISESRAAESLGRKASTSKSAWHGLPAFSRLMVEDLPIICKPGYSTWHHIWLSSQCDRRLQPVPCQDDRTVTETRWPTFA